MTLRGYCIASFHSHCTSYRRAVWQEACGRKDDIFALQVDNAQAYASDPLVAQIISEQTSELLEGKSLADHCDAYVREHASASLAHALAAAEALAELNKSNRQQAAKLLLDALASTGDDPPPIGTLVMACLTLSGSIQPLAVCARRFICSHASQVRAAAMLSQLHKHTLPALRLPWNFAGFLHKHCR